MEHQPEMKLARVAAPEGFADAVMARIASERQLDREPKPKRDWFVWMRPAVAMAVLLLAVGVGIAMHWQNQRRQEALEQARFEQAMRITSRTLAHVGAEVSSVREHTLRP